jgi:hypothetical protein
MFLQNFKHFCGGCILVLCAKTGVHGAINIDAFASAQNDRYANNAQFIMNQYDLSGVAIANDGRFVTMISENVFLSAHHFYPSNGTSVTFYTGNDPSGTSATRTIQSSQRIGTTDIRIGILNSPLSSAYKTYDFSTEDITSFSNGSNAFTRSDIYLQNAFILGRSPTAFATSQDLAVGRNLIDRWYSSVTVSGTTDSSVVSVVNSSGDANFVTHEAHLQIGDSSAPMFIDNGSGGLTMAGINWFIGNDGSNDLNGQSYLGNYDTEIQNYIDANEVPEMQHFGLFLSLALGIQVLRRRKQ